MTAVRVREAGCYAVTTSSQQILILNRFKKITVASVDNFKPLFDAMRMDPDKEISVEHLNNANIVYALSAELGIEPGIFVEGDKTLLDFFHRQISEDVNAEDRDQLIKELIDSWNVVAAHPLLKKYIQLGEYLRSEGSACVFSPMSAFELFVHDYFAGCIRGFVNNGSNEFELLKEWTHLVFSTLHGFGLSPNRYLKTELFLNKVNKILVETGNNRAQVKTFIAKIVQEHDMFNASWFVAIRDWAKFELQDVEQTDGAGEALTALLEGLPVSHDELKEHLADLIAQFTVVDTSSNALMNSCSITKVSEDIVVINKLMKEVIAYAVVSYSLAEGITLYAVPLVAPFPRYRQAGRNAACEEDLVNHLLLDENSTQFLPYELYAIEKKARSKVLKEVVQGIVEKRAKQEEVMCRLFGNLSLSSVSAWSVLTAAQVHRPVVAYQYRRLQNVMSGKTPIRFQIAAEEIDEHQTKAEENPKNALFEAQNLQKQGSCVII